MVQIPPAGREYVTWTLTAPPASAGLEVTFDHGTTWHPLTTDGATATILCAGPDAADNPTVAVVLTAGRHFAQIRAIDNPEVIIRGAGAVDVT